MDVLIADGLGKEGIDLLEEEGFRCVVDKCSADDLVKKIRDYKVLVVRSRTKVIPEVIAAADNLDIIARAGIGVDNIDQAAASERGIAVVNAPDGNTVSAAEHTVALMLGIAKNLFPSYGALKYGLWNKSANKGVELAGKTLGIVGYGKIGNAVSQRLAGFDMEILVYDPMINGDGARQEGVECVDMDSLLMRSDIVTLHASRSKTDPYIIAEEQLAKMKKDAYLINTSRGPNVKEGAVYDWLIMNPDARFGTDVFENEPKIDPCTYNNPICVLPNVMVTPHIAASTDDAQKKTALQTAERIIGYLKKNETEYLLNKDKINGR